MGLTLVCPDELRALFRETLLDAYAGSSIVPLDEIASHHSQHCWACELWWTPDLFTLGTSDNRDAAQTLAMLLQANGHRVETAFDGPSAVAVASEYRPNLILCDLGLPGFDGFEVAKAVRHDLDLGNVVLVAMTGYGTEADKERSRSAGFDHHLTKPADFREVEQILATVAGSVS